MLHETGHKDHWDQARRLYKNNPKKYNSVEDAKHYLDDRRREALVRKRYSDPDFIVRNVSENADVGLSRKGTINEFQADYYVRQCQGTVTDELKVFLEGTNHDALNFLGEMPALKADAPDNIKRDFEEWLRLSSE